jgi:hypothetical protein
VSVNTNSNTAVTVTAATDGAIGAQLLILLFLFEQQLEAADGGITRAFILNLFHQNKRFSLLDNVLFVILSSLFASLLSFLLSLLTLFLGRKLLRVTV